MFSVLADVALLSKPPQSCCATVHIYIGIVCMSHTSSGDDGTVVYLEEFPVMAFPNFKGTVLSSILCFVTMRLLVVSPSLSPSLQN